MADINDGYYRIGKAWQLDNQREADDYRYRVIESDYLSAFNATRKTFLALGMPLESGAIEKGILTAENIAPAPLTLEEWMEVKRIETPRLKELGGSLFSFPDNPKNFTITVNARLKDLGRGKVILSVDYVMASPTYKSMGMAVTPHAPPTAVKLGMLKFWRQLEIELKNTNAPPPRKRAWNEEARYENEVYISVLLLSANI